MADTDTQKEQNYWPGFVDALSNVVLTLVFVLVVFVFALVITSGRLTQKAYDQYEKRMTEAAEHARTIDILREQLASAEAAREDADKAVAALQDRVESLKSTETQLAKTRQAFEDLKADYMRRDAQRAASLLENQVEVVVEGTPPVAPGNTSQRAEIVESVGVIVITFPRGVVTLNDKAKAELTRVLAPHRSAIAGATASLTSLTGAETYSEGKRLAYYRALDLRNFLIGTGAASRQSVAITTQQSANPGDARVEVRFIRKQ